MTIDITLTNHYLSLDPEQRAAVRVAVARSRRFLTGYGQEPAAGWVLALFNELAAAERDRRRPAWPPVLETKTQ